MTARSRGWFLRLVPLALEGEEHCRLALIRYSFICLLACLLAFDFFLVPLLQIVQACCLSWLSRRGRRTRGYKGSSTATFSWSEGGPCIPKRVAACTTTKTSDVIRTPVNLKREKGTEENSNERKVRIEKRPQATSETGVLKYTKRYRST